MIDIEKLDLKWYEKDEIEDLIEEYPHLLEMPLNEIKKFKTELYWKAQGLIDRAYAIESKADALQIIIDAMEG